MDGDIEPAADASQLAESTHANPVTPLGWPSASRLGPIPQWSRGWTPRVTGLTRASRPTASSARLAACSGGAAQARLPAVVAAPPCSLRAQCCLACGAGLDARPWLASRATLAAPEPTAGSRACARRRGCAPRTPDGGLGRLARCRGPTGSAPPAPHGPAGAGAVRGAAAERLAPSLRRCRIDGS